MKRLSRLAVLFILALASAFAADIDGKWTATVEANGFSFKITWTLKADGDKITGGSAAVFGDMPVNTPIKDGKIAGKDLTWTEESNFGGNAFTITTKATLNGDELKISRSFGNDFPPMEMVAKRDK